MGACCDNRTEVEKDVDNEVATDCRKESQVFKLLFLGSGDSGKSTFFKQLRKIHGEGYSDVYRRSFIPPIHNQIVNEMQHALQLITYLASEHPERYSRLALSDCNEAQESRDICLCASKLNAEVAHAISYLWMSEPVIKEIYEMRATLKLADSTEFFWNDIERIAHDEFLPTDGDLVLVRNPTTGLYEQVIDIDGYQFQIVDVGGQRTERRKWIHQFENVTAVIFIASLSCFDAVLYEDDTANAMREQLTLFKDICNNDYFMKTAMILLLNKRDIFQEKILADPENINIRNVWSEFDGDVTSYQECAHFIRLQFECLNENPRRNIFVHLSCATDTNNVKKIFNDIQHIIVSSSLSQAGLISQ
jgi:GTPase SAR1 family protein